MTRTFTTMTTLLRRRSAQARLNELFEVELNAWAAFNHRDWRARSGVERVPDHLKIWSFWWARNGVLTLDSLSGVLNQEQQQ